MDRWDLVVPSPVHVSKKSEMGFLCIYSICWGLILNRGLTGVSESHVSCCFWLFAPKFWEVMVIYECYFVTLWLQVEWWGHSEVVGIPAVIEKNWLFCTHRWWGYKNISLPHARARATWWNFHNFLKLSCVLLDGFGRKIKSLYKKQPQTIVATAFKNGSREIFHRIAAPNLKMVRIYK